MKNLFIVAILFVASAAFAEEELKCLNFANKESRPYRLDPVNIGVLCNGAASKVKPVICYREAIRLPRQNLGKHNAAVLCSAAAPTFSPIGCYKRAIKAMGKNQKIAAATVCSRATDLEPLSCAREVKESRNLKMDWEGAAALCTQGFVARKKSDNLTHL